MLRFARALRSPVLRVARAPRTRAAMLPLGLGVSLGLTRRAFQLDVTEPRVLELESKAAETIPSLELAPEPESHLSLLRMLLPDLPAFFGAIVLAVTSSRVSLYIPQIAGQLLDALKAGELTTQRLVAALGTILLHALLQGCSITAITYAAERMSARLRSLLFASLVEREVATFDKHTVGELVEGVTSDVYEMKHTAKKLIASGLRHIARSVGGVIALFSISPKLTGLLLAIAPPMVLIGTLMGRHLASLSAEQRAANLEASSSATEALSNIRVVKSYTNEQHEAERFSAQVNEAADASLKFGAFLALFRGAVTVGMSGLVLALFAYGGQLVDHGELSTGQLTSFLMFANTVQTSLGELTGLIGQLLRGAKSAENVRRALQDYTPQHAGHALVQLDGDIVFDQVRFSYPTRPDAEVLRGLDLVIPRGKVVALVGPTGEGKSTIASVSVCTRSLSVRSLSARSLSAHFACFDSCS
jgi:ABC-type multidrug transport system fused ATPase/permease subunit